MSCHRGVINVFQPDVSVVLRHPIAHSRWWHMSIIEYLYIWVSTKPSISLHLTLWLMLEPGAWADADRGIGGGGCGGGGVAYNRPAPLDPTMIYASLMQLTLAIVYGSGHIFYCLLVLVGSLFTQPVAIVGRIAWVCINLGLIASEYIKPYRFI